MMWKLSKSGFKRINSSNTRPILSYHMAHKPEYLNIRVLPEKHKLETTKKFKQFVGWVNEHYTDPHVIKQANNIADGVCNYMNNESYYDDSWDEFNDFNSKLDNIRYDEKDSINNISSFSK